MINTKYKLKVAELMRAVDRHNASGHFAWIGSDGWSARGLVTQGWSQNSHGFCFLVFFVFFFYFHWFCSFCFFVCLVRIWWVECKGACHSWLASIRSLLLLFLLLLLLLFLLLLFCCFWCLPWSDPIGCLAVFNQSSFDIIMIYYQRFKHFLN